MRQLCTMLALLIATAMPVLASGGTGGFLGHVYGPDGRPLDGAQVAFFRLPMTNVDRAVAVATTNSKGYYSRMLLQPGRYMVAVATGKNAGDCAVEQAFADGMTRSDLRVHPGTGCRGPKSYASMVNPAITGDYTLVH